MVWCRSTHTVALFLKVEFVVWWLSGWLKISPPLLMHKSDPEQLQELKQWSNGLMPKFTHHCSFLKNWICGLMVEWLTENIPPLQMDKSDPGQLQEWKQWLNGWVPRYTPRCSFLKHWIGVLMVEWLTENIPPLHMHKSDPRQLQELKQFYTDISTTLCKTIAFILLWFDGSCFKQCLTFFGKAKSEHFVSLNTGWLPKSSPCAHENY